MVETADRSVDLLFFFLIFFMYNISHGKKYSGDLGRVEKGDRETRLNKRIQ